MHGNWIRKLCERKAAEIIEGNVSIDQLHFVLSFTLKHPATQVIGGIKGRVAIRSTERLATNPKKHWERRL